MIVLVFFLQVTSIVKTSATFSSFNTLQSSVATTVVNNFEDWYGAFSKVRACLHGLRVSG